MTIHATTPVEEYDSLLASIASNDGMPEPPDPDDRPQGDGPSRGRPPSPLSSRNPPAASCTSPPPG